MARARDAACAHLRPILSPLETLPPQPRHYTGGARKILWRDSGKIRPPGLPRFRSWEGRGRLPDRGDLDAGLEAEPGTIGPVNGEGEGACECGAGAVADAAPTSPVDPAQIRRRDRHPSAAADLFASAREPDAVPFDEEEELVARRDRELLPDRRRNDDAPSIAELRRVGLRRLLLRLVGHVHHGTTSHDSCGRRRGVT